MSSSSGSVTDRVIAHVSGIVGSQPQKASVTFLGVQPVDVLRFADGDEVVFATVGCSRHPMTDPTEIVADPTRGPRAEVTMRMRATAPLQGLHKSLAMLAAAPAVEGLILDVDSLVDLQQPLWAGAICSAFLLSADERFADLPLDEPAEPVRFLRAVPITANEAAWVRLKGAAELRAAWAEADVDVTDPTRAAVTPG